MAGVDASPNRGVHFGGDAGKMTTKQGAGGGALNPTDGLLAAKKFTNKLKDRQKVRDDMLDQTNTSLAAHWSFGPAGDHAGVGGEINPNAVESKDLDLNMDNTYTKWSMPSPSPKKRG